MKSKALRFLLALLISLGIWMYVVMVVSPESEATIRNIPVMLNGENVLAERNLIVVSDKNFVVDLRLFGNRVDLNKLSASNITILADLTQITEPGEHNIRYDISYPGVVDSGSIDPLERNPQYITIQVAERGWKEVPVKVEYGDTRVPEGYVVDRQNPQFDHTVITVSGPKETLEQVHYAKIRVDLTGKTETIVGNFQPQLCDAEGNPLEGNEAVHYVDKLSTDINTIKATIGIYKIKEVPVVVDVIAGGGLTVTDISLQQSLKTIVVSGSDAVLQNLDKIVLGQIHLADLQESTTLNLPVTMPSGVNNITGVTEVTVDVTMLQQLETRTFTITQFTLAHVANRYVRLVTKAITVTIRGTKEALDALNAEDIVAEVDVKDVANMADKTTTILKVTIRMPDDSTAGAIGEYQVLAEITAMGSGNTGG